MDKKSYSKMSDKQIKNYLMRKVKKAQIIKIVCEEYDMYWFDDDFKNTKEVIIDMFFEPIKDHLLTMGYETFEQMYKRLAR